ncbi:MAG: hypothetical protein CMH26_09075 [Micavibrio sp.]|nr:hypothetical protein [Micavibrio sp.]|tara:strand:+ start:2198 stop:2524 length:327 start_codon:yes stop_codon:yes gene_type:complete
MNQIKVNFNTASGSNNEIARVRKECSRIFGGVSALLKPNENVEFKVTATDGARPDHPKSLLVSYDATAKYASEHLQTQMQANIALIKSKYKVTEYEEEGSHIEFTIMG